MPNRVIREGWVESEAVDRLSPDAERFFLRLCLKADDFGRYHANPQLLKSNLYPLKTDICLSHVSQMLAECVKAKLVFLYQVENKQYLEIPKFNARMRAKKSKFPAPMTDICPSDDCHMRTEARTESESESSTESGARTEAKTALAPGGTAEIPSWEEWSGYIGKLTDGKLPEWYSRDKFLAQESARPPWGRVGPWIKYAERVIGWWISDGKPTEPKAAGNGAATSNFWQSKAKLDIVEAEIKKIEDRASQTATGPIIEPQDRDRYKQLKVQRKQLKTQCLK